MPLKVHIHEHDDPEFLRHLKQQLDPEIELTVGEKIPDPAEYEILIWGVPDRTAIEASSSITTLVVPWAGLPKKTRALMREFPDIAVHNIHHNAVPTAEMAITLMLAAAKNLVNTDSMMRNHDWRPRYIAPTMQLMAGRRALILGFGAIGQAIASRCQALGMEVTVVSRRGGSQEGAAKVESVDALDQLLPNADAILLAIPLTDETDGMIGKTQLALLPEGAVVVNISRGAIIDEKALYESLKSGRIRAGIDVWYNYPKSEECRSDTPPSQFPFHELTNVVMTPHLAGHSDRTERLRADSIAELLNLAAKESPLPWRVDLKSGY